MSPTVCAICERLVPSAPILLIVGARAIPFCRTACLADFADEWAEEVCRLALVKGGHGFAAEYYRAMPTLTLELDFPTVN